MSPHQHFRGFVGNISISIDIHIERKDEAARESSPGLGRTKAGSGARSRSGSPASFDMRDFEKEKSPFLAVKSLLKPV